MLHEIKKRFKGDNEFERLYWLTGIKKPKDSMIYHHKKYMQCKDNKLVNTDGTELREIEVNLPDGYYEIVSRKRSSIVLSNGLSLDEGKYPDYEDILNPSNECVNVELCGLDNGLQYAIREMKECGFDPFKYMDITSIKEVDTCKAYVHPDGKKPLVLTGEFYRAALMPIV
jgi:hypothetical protein